MLSYAGKARDIYKTLQWTTDGDTNKFDKVCEAFKAIARPARTLSARNIFAAFDKTVNLSARM